MTPEPRKLEDASFRELAAALLKLIGFKENFVGELTIHFDGRVAQNFSYRGVGKPTARHPKPLAHHGVEAYVKAWMTSK